MEENKKTKPEANSLSQMWKLEVGNKYFEGREKEVPTVSGNGGHLKGCEEKLEVVPSDTDLSSR